MTQLLEGSNYHQTRRHYATEMRPMRHGDGLEGRSLCSSEALPTEIYDQEGHDYWARTALYHNAQQVADLPLCKRCEKQAQKLGLEVPS